MLIYLSLKITKGSAVQKMPYKTWLLAAILVLMPWAAHAAGLGKLTVLSALGQPLSAQIDLVSVQKDELATLSARIAAPEAFTQANVQYSPALVGARVSIEKRAQGQPYIKITSSRAINEPFLSVLVELSWAQGRLVREYTALIDPPGFAPGAQNLITENRETKIVWPSASSISINSKVSNSFPLKRVFLALKSTFR